MARIEIENESLRLAIEPRLGAGIADFSLRNPAGAWHPLLRRAPDQVRWFNDLGCYVLAPWSNRITGGRFAFAGQQRRVAPDWPDGSAIHGLVKDRRWRIVERTPVSALLEVSAREMGPVYPWPFDAGARYELFDDALSVRIGVTNRSDEPMPAGLGFHPFFPRALWDPRDRVAVRYGAIGRYPAQHMIPTGRPREDEVAALLNRGGPIGDLALDDVFLGSTNGAAIEWPASGVRVRFECSPNLTHGVVYTGGADAAALRLPFFCLEPVTMVNDGFNLAAREWADTGVAHLAPGCELSATWTLRIERMH